MVESRVASRRTLGRGRIDYPSKSTRILEAVDSRARSEIRSRRESSIVQLELNAAVELRGNGHASANLFIRLLG